MSIDSRDARPIVIGHRGAPGYRPEHTLASYELAVRMGADYVDVDLVPTRDGVLVCRHDPDIARTTDVADRPEFSERKKTVQLAGAAVSGWFAEDFTAEELARLRAVERLPDLRQHNTMWDGRFGVPTFEQVLDLRVRLSRELGREIGVYPELKHPMYFRAAGLPTEELLTDVLRRYGLDDTAAPVFVQCFEPTGLRRLRELGVRARLTQLLGPGHPELATAAWLASVATYAQCLGPEKSLVVPRADDGTLGRPSGLVAAAHDAGLLVHAYTFRAENAFLPKDFQVGSPAEPGDYGRGIDEQVAHLRAGVDGVFTDQPDVGVDARAQFLARQLPG